MTQTQNTALQNTFGSPTKGSNPETKSSTTPTNQEEVVECLTFKERIKQIESREDSFCSKHLDELIPWSSVSSKAIERWSRDIANVLYRKADSVLQEELDNSFTGVFKCLERMDAQVKRCWDDVYGPIAPPTIYPAVPQDTYPNARKPSLNLKTHASVIRRLSKRMSSGLKMENTFSEMGDHNPEIQDISDRVQIVVRRMNRLLSDLNGYVGDSSESDGILDRAWKTASELKSNYLSLDVYSDIITQLNHLSSYSHPYCQELAYHPVNKTICCLCKPITLCPEGTDYEVDLGVFMLELSLIDMAKEWPSPSSHWVPKVHLLAGPSDYSKTYIHPHVSSVSSINFPGSLCLGGNGWDTLTKFGVSSAQFNILVSLDVALAVLSSYNPSDAYSRLTNFTRSSSCYVQDGLEELEGSEESEDDDEERYVVCEATGADMHINDSNCIEYDGHYFDDNETVYSEVQDTYIDINDSVSMCNEPGYAHFDQTLDAAVQSKAEDPIYMLTDFNPVLCVNTGHCFGCMPDEITESIYTVVEEGAADGEGFLPIPSIMYHILCQAYSEDERVRYENFEIFYKTIAFNKRHGSTFCTEYLRLGLSGKPFLEVSGTGRMSPVSLGSTLHKCVNSIISLDIHSSSLSAPYSRDATERAYINRRIDIANRYLFVPAEELSLVKARLIVGEDISDMDVIFLFPTKHVCEDFSGFKKVLEAATPFENIEITKLKLKESDPND